ncbi:FAS-associated factor 1-like [Ornithodoros turicata]|uniref:FAS-associated factor 1-like n=1 Tax=Ornithodoros turicata TaxID=34597 RepID=UPI003139AA9D
MEEQRDQVLADFQSCTGMEDVGECFMYLEQANWNLLDAIHRALPEETQSLPSEQIPVPSGPSNSMPRLLSVNVRYHDNTAQLMLPDSVTVGEVKSAIQGELGVAPCRQVLRGWRRNNVADETVISTLELPADHTLQLSTTEEEIQPPVEEDSIKLNITDKTANKSYSINFPASRTLLQIKQDVCDLTSIPVSQQRWTGWPAHRDSASLRTVSQGQSELDLCVCRDSTPKKKHPVVDLVSSDSSPEEEEFEDASECLFQGRTHRPLMAEGTQDERAAITQFTEEFKNRYGACHPVFMEGTLSEALEASCQRSCRERRPLAVYLHHDGSVLTNVFCTQLLCSEAIVTYLTLNFITWAWDLTLDSNRDRFLTSVTSSLGPAACLAIRNVAVDHLPALLVITRVRAATEVLTVIPGNVSLDELMTRLVHAVEVFNSELSTEMREEEEREARETVKKEQDMAYQASLMADQAKEEARKQEEMEVKRQREMLFEEQQRKEAIQQSLAEQLPPEPSEGSLEAVSTIRVRLPTGETVSRRFLASSPLSTLITFVGSRGYPPHEYKVLASWPRRDLSTMDPSQSLQQLQLYPKETITLEER